MYSPPEHEFDSFPPTVKRKYFSSLERLRLAQRSISSATCPTPTIASRNRTQTRPSTANSRPSLRSRNSSYFRNPHSRFLKQTPLPSDSFSYQEARWFQILPEKVQRKHFTREEQRLLAGHRESFILDAADKSVLRVGRQRNNSVPTAQTSYSYSSSSSVHTLVDELPSGSAVGMDGSIMDSFRWMDDDEDLDLSLDDYHSHLAASTEPTSSSSSRRPSFRRTHSLTAISPTEASRSTSPQINLRSAASTQLPLELPDTSHSKAFRRPRAAISQPQLRDKSSLPIMNQSTIYYQDPEARLKLRVYLASPSKFDEALEFGFPSLESRENLQERGPFYSRDHFTEPPPQTFYDSETPSFFDNLESESDAESLPEDSPNTPSDTMFRNTHRLPTSKPVSSDTERPVAFASKTRGEYIKPADPYSLAGDREMTLRMTLTRPELRASESLLYGTADDPLALEQLPQPPSPEPLESGREGGGRVKRLWRKVSGRG